MAKNSNDNGASMAAAEQQMLSKMGACEPDNNTGCDKNYDQGFDERVPVGPALKNGSNDCSCMT